VQYLPFPNVPKKRLFRADTGETIPVPAELDPKNPAEMTPGRMPFKPNPGTLVPFGPFPER